MCARHDTNPRFDHVFSDRTRREMVSSRLRIRLSTSTGRGAQASPSSGHSAANPCAVAAGVPRPAGYTAIQLPSFRSWRAPYRGSVLLKALGNHATRSGAIQNGMPKAEEGRVGEED